MALDITKLQNELLNSVFNLRTDDKQEAAEAWANAYILYAQDATSCQGASPTFSEAIKNTFASQIRLAFENGFISQNVAQTAGFFAIAFAPFWLGTIFPPNGIVLPGPVNVLASGLQSIWIGGNSSPPQSATQHASILDAYTRTVSVSHPTPGAPCALTLV